MENGEIESADEEMSFRGGRHYTRVVSHEQAGIQMSPIEIISPPGILPKQERANFQANHTTDGIEGSSNVNDGHGEQKKESMLELFDFDSLVSVLGLRRYRTEFTVTGEQNPTTSSPSEGEDVAITLGRPKETTPKLGTLLGVFVPCLQSILGIIYYIRFSCRFQGL